MARTAAVQILVKIGGIAPDQPGQRAQRVALILHDSGEASACIALLGFEAVERVLQVHERSFPMPRGIFPIEKYFS